VVGASYPKTATLTYTSAANQNGTATISYHAHDNGGTANGGVDNNPASPSPDLTFTITVNAVNDPPVVVAPAAFAVQANMKRTGLTGLLGNVSDTADAGVGTIPCVPTPFTVTSGSISATTPAGGTISNVNLSTGTFDFDPPPGVTGDVTFTYTVSDTGCPGVAISAPVTVHVTVSGPVIWFVNPTSANPAAAGDGRLSNPFTRLDQATTAIGLNASQRIFVFTGFGSTVAGTTVTLQGSGTQAAAQWLVGQGAIDAGGFDTLMGISPPAGTIARPTINGTRPNILGTVTMKDNTVVQGLNINVSAGATKGLTALNWGTNTALTIKDVNVSPLPAEMPSISATALSTVNRSPTPRATLQPLPTSFHPRPAPL